MAHVCAGMKFRPLNQKGVDRMALRLRFFLFHVDRRIHGSYTWWFFACECLNLINVVGQERCHRLEMEITPPCELSDGLQG